MVMRSLLGRAYRTCPSDVVDPDFVLIDARNWMDDVREIIQFMDECAGVYPANDGWRTWEP